MKELKEYTDKDGYIHRYYGIDDLCAGIVCYNCHFAGRCERENTSDCCYEYNEQYKILEKEGIK